MATMVASDGSPSSATAIPAASLAGDTQIIRVLLVDDDPYYREMLADGLSAYGFAVQGFAEGGALLRSLDSTADADIIILDWGLPKTSGIDLILQLRRHGVALPVVFLTGHALADSETLAFDRGAADFINKSYSVEKLAGRLRRAVEHGGPPDEPRADKRLVCGKLVLRPNISRAYWDQMDVGLTPGEYNIVHLLASNVGRCVTHRTIHDRLDHEGFIAGSGEHGYRANVRSAIKRIRGKFLECDPAFLEITDYAAFGYCWGKPAD